MEAIRDRLGNLDFSDFVFTEQQQQWHQFTELSKWLSDQDFSTWHKAHAWTFTFRYEQSVDSAKKKMRHFLNVLNKKVYGNAHRRYNKSLKCIPVIEKDDQTRIHYHLILEHLSRGKMTPATYELIMQSLWQYGQVKSNGLFVNDDDSSWKDYILKKRTKNEVKDLSIDIENMSL